MTSLPRLVDSNLRLHPLSLSVNESITPLSTATMTLPKGESITARSYVEIFTPIGSAGYFRARSPENAYGEDITSIELEHAICEVGDYLVKAEISEMMAANTAMTTLFGYYGGSRWQLGSVSALGSGQVAVEAKYDRVLDAMLSILQQKPDCMMAFDFSTSPWTVSVVAKGTTVSAEGRLGRNVRSARVIYDDTELCTRVYYQIPSTDQSGQPTSVWTYMDADTISTYGVIERTMTSASDYTLAEANAAATEYLRQHKEPRATVDISGEELSAITGESLDTFTLGKLFRLSLVDYNTTVDENITSITWNDVFNAPDDVQVRLGDEEDTVITFLHDVDTKGGSGGGGGAGRNTEELFKEYRTRFEQDDYHFNLVAQHVDTHDNILEQAGMYIDSHGVLIYADENPNMVGAKFGTLEVTVDGINQTVGTISGEVTTLDGKVTTIEGSALWTQRNAITGVVGEFEVHTDPTTGEKTLVIKSGGGLKILRNNVEFGIYDEGTLTAGVIATTVNGTPSTYIYGSNIVMSSSDSTPVNVKVNGKLEASDITANFLDAKIATIPIMHGMSASFTGSIRVGSTLYLGSDPSDTSGNVSTAVKQLQIVQGSTSGTYKLQKKSFNDSDWVDVGNFNTATALTGAWSSGTFTVTASPQGNTITTAVYKGTGAAFESWSGNTYTGTIVYYPDGQHQGSVGRTFTVDATARYNAGYSAGTSDGWDLARTFCVAPSAGTNATMSVGIPASTYNQASSYSFTVSVDENYAYITNSLGTVVARTSNSYTPTITVNVTTNGWTGIGDEAPRITFSPSSGSGTSSTASVKILQNSGDTSGNGSVTLQGKVDSGTWTELNTLAIAMVADSGWSSNQKTIRLRYGGTSTDRATLTVDASAVYVNGQNSITISSVQQNSAATYNSSTNNYSVGAEATASNGNTGTGTLVFSASEAYNAGSSAGYASAKLSGAWSNNVFTVTKGTNGSDTSVSTTITAGITYDSSTHKYTAQAKTGSTVRSSTTGGTEAYTAGVSAGGTAAGLTYNTSTHKISRSTSSSTKEYTVSMSTGSWSSGSIPVYASIASGVNINSTSVSIPAVSSTTWTNTSGRTWRADISIGGVTRSSSTKDFGGYYTDGYNAGYSNGSPSSVTIGSQVTGTTYNCTVTRNDGSTVAKTINVGSAEYNRGWNAYRSTLLSSSNNNTYLYYGSYYGTLYVAPTGGATAVYYCVGYATGFTIPAAK